MRHLYKTHSVDAAELQSNESDDDGEKLPADIDIEEEVDESLDLYTLQESVFSQHVLHLWFGVLFSSPEPA